MANNQWDAVTRPQTSKPRKSGLEDDIDDLLDDAENSKGIESSKPPTLARAKTAGPTRHQPKHSFGMGGGSVHDDLDDLEDDDALDHGAMLGSARGSDSKQYDPQ